MGEHVAAAAVVVVAIVALRSNPAPICLDRLLAPLAVSAGERSYLLLFLSGSAP